MTPNLLPSVARTHPQVSTTPIEQVAPLSSPGERPVQAFVFFTSHLNSLRYTCARGHLLPSVRVGVACAIVNVTALRGHADCCGRDAQLLPLTLFPSLP